MVAPNETKLLIIYVLHEIMLETKVIYPSAFSFTQNSIQDRQFVMAFGDISRALFTEVAEYNLFIFKHMLTW